MRIKMKYRNVACWIVAIAFGFAISSPVSAQISILPTQEAATEGLVDRLNQQTLDLTLQEKYEEAAAAAEHAIEAGEPILGLSNPALAISFDRLLTVYHLQKQYDKAEALLLRLIRSYDSTPNETHPSLAPSLSRLADLYREQEQYIKAEPLYLRALSIQEKRLGANHPAAISAIETLANLYKATDNPTQAQQFLQRLNTLRQQGKTNLR
ncbi:hypothetical protein NIES2135_60190 (plasmid) [Leptolyngbya boryana NIES-2135]|jgi:tetratricopeptide (TPR) repeat protein|uniref:Tetratricopeptide repeat protein n=2 Tax=Leptolyngbya group TaxID=3081713 RepID=A0A1Z4JQX5_LEPBY|nr:hypothetical protein NIES2135_60190 [Leptolyngbya boryana NIES-2135]